MAYEAILETGGKQFAVSVGDVIRVPLLGGSAGDRVAFDRVLVSRQGEEIRTGRPHLEGAHVEGEIVGQDHDRKLIVFRFHQNTSYRRKTGHRQPHTAVRITAVHA